MTEPTIIFAGDTVSWTKTLTEYPAPTWVLEYYAVTDNSQLVIPAIGTDENHNVNVEASATETWEPGSYRWVAKVRQAAIVHTIDSGEWRVERNIALDQTGYDARSHAQIVVDELENLYEQHLADFGLVSNYSIGDVLFTFSSAENVYQMLARARKELRDEKAKERIHRGKLGNPSIKIVQ